MSIRDAAERVSQLQKPSADGEISSVLESGRKASQATRLIGLADNAELFHDGDTEYVAIIVDEHSETYKVRSKAFKSWLKRSYYHEYGAAPRSQSVEEALGVLEGRAQHDGPCVPVHLRIGQHDGAIYLDLCDETWRAVRIDVDGYHVVAQPGIRFRRTKGMLPLPMPRGSGSVADLRPFLNVEDEDSFIRLVAFLIGSLNPSGPCPILQLHGEQGSAKTTTARVIKALGDPSISAVRSEPKEPRDLMIAANNGWILAFDNLSHLPGWLSDWLCRLSTGGGFSTRQLYTDDEEIILDAKRPVVANGIEEIATRPDLLDRIMSICLPPIPEHKRFTEEEFWRKFDQARPAILGALFGAVSQALRDSPHLRIERLPRMADFALFVTATESALGFAKGSFIAAYRRDRERSHDLAIEASPIGLAFLRFVESTAGWSGTATDLLHELTKQLPPDDPTAARARTWPKNGRALSGALRRVAPNLRALGINVTFNQGARPRLIEIVKADNRRDFASDATLASEPNATDAVSDVTDATGGRSDADSLAANPREPGHPTHPTHPTQATQKILPSLFPEAP